MWANIHEAWYTWLPIFWKVALVLFGVSVMCIVLYLVKKRALRVRG